MAGAEHLRQSESISDLYWSDVSRLYFTKKWISSVKWWIFTDVLFHKDVPKSILPLPVRLPHISKRSAAGASLHRVSLGTRDETFEGQVIV